MHEKFDVAVAESYDGREQRQSYKEFFAPVYVMNAIVRALKNGKEELVAE